MEHTENLWVESSKEHIKRSGNGYKCPENVIKKFLIFFGTRKLHIRVALLTHWILDQSTFLSAMGPAGFFSFSKREVLLFFFSVLVQGLNLAMHMHPLRQKREIPLLSHFFRMAIPLTLPLER